MKLVKKSFLLDNNIKKKLINIVKMNLNFMLRLCTQRVEIQLENVVFIRKNRTFYNYRDKYRKFYVFLLYFDNQTCFY